MSTKLFPGDLDVFKKRKPVFLKAQALTGVPWQAIAAIWYRESFSVTPPKTPGGPFQFDPIPAHPVLDGLLQSFTHVTPAERERLISLGVNDFEAGAIFCACWLRLKSKFNLATDHSDEAMKDAFYGYNGRAWGPHPESSPYVNNGADAHHTDMHIRGSVPDGHGGRRWIDNVDKRPGAFVVYKQLIDAKI